MKTYLIVQSYCLEVEDDYDPSLLSKNIINCDNIQIDENHTAKWNQLGIYILDSRGHNCVKCSFCDSWMTDVNKDNPITGVSKGIEIDGKYYCVNCLQKKT